MIVFVSEGEKELEKNRKLFQHEQAGAVVLDGKHTHTEEPEWEERKTALGSP